MISKNRRSMRTNINPFVLNTTKNNNQNTLTVNKNQIETLANIQLNENQSNYEQTELMDTGDDTATDHREDEFNNFFGKSQERDFEELFEETQPFEDTNLNDGTNALNEIFTPKHKNATSFIYNGSTVLTKEASYYVFAFMTRFNLDGNCCDEFLKLIQYLLPHENTFPKTMNVMEKIIGLEKTLVHVKDYCQTCRSEIRCFGPLNFNQNEIHYCQCTGDMNDFDNFFHVNVFDKITYIVQNYFETIQTYLSTRRESLDIIDGSYYRKLAKANKLHLIICSDGTPIRKSSKRKEFWPVILSLAELPRGLRDSIKNKIICGNFKI